MSAYFHHRYPEPWTLYTCSWLNFISPCTLTLISHLLRWYLYLNQNRNVSDCCCKQVALLCVVVVVDQCWISCVSLSVLWMGNSVIIVSTGKLFHKEAAGYFREPNSTVLYQATTCWGVYMTRFHCMPSICSSSSPCWATHEQCIASSSNWVRH